MEPTEPHTGATTQQKITASQGEERQEQPLGSFKLGDAVLTLGGFIGFENIFRTTNTQSNIATSFAAIPYNNTAQGNVSESCRRCAVFHFPISCQPRTKPNLPIEAP
jgi:hypothetical protein